MSIMQKEAVVLITRESFECVVSFYESSSDYLTELDEECVVALAHFTRDRVHVEGKHTGLVMFTATRNPDFWKEWDVKLSDVPISQELDKGQVQSAIHHFERHHPELFKFPVTREERKALYRRGVNK